MRLQRERGIETVVANISQTGELTPAAARPCRYHENRDQVLNKHEMVFVFVMEGKPKAPHLALNLALEANEH